MEEKLLVERVKRAEQLIGMDEARLKEIDTDIEEVDQAIKELRAYYEKRLSELLRTQDSLNRDRENAARAFMNHMTELETLRHSL